MKNLEFVIGMILSIVFFGAGILGCFVLLLASGGSCC